MDKFPDSLNRFHCNEKMKKKQTELIKETRQEFYDRLIRETELCKPEVTLIFPDNLWHEHKIIIIQELLERFGKLKLITSNPQCSLVKLITNLDDAPISVNKISIEFYNHD